MTLKLDWCSHAAAKYAVEHWHYSRCMPKSKQAYIGVWESGAFIGVLVVGYSTTPFLGSSFGLSQQQAVELTRIALKAGHQCAVSRVIAIATKMIRSVYTGLRLIVSYADPNVGHAGAIYQASNWVYVGSVPGRTQFCIAGKWRNDAPAFRMARSQDYQTRRILGKHKYLYPLDAAMRQQIEPLRKPYPKRATSILADAPVVQTGEDGSTPIVALQTLEAVRG